MANISCSFNQSAFKISEKLDAPGVNYDQIAQDWIKDILFGNIATKLDNHVLMIKYLKAIVSDVES